MKSYMIVSFVQQNPVPFMKKMFLCKKKRQPHYMSNSESQDSTLTSARSHVILAVHQLTVFKQILESVRSRRFISSCLKFNFLSIGCHIRIDNKSNLFYDFVHYESLKTMHSNK